MAKVFFYADTSLLKILLKISFSILETELKQAQSLQTRSQLKRQRDTWVSYRWLKILRLSMEPCLTFGVILRNSWTWVREIVRNTPFFSATISTISTINRTGWISSLMCVLGSAIQRERQPMLWGEILVTIMWSFGTPCVERPTSLEEKNKKMFSSDALLHQRDTLWTGPLAMLYVSSNLLVVFSTQKTCGLIFSPLMTQDLLITILIIPTSGSHSWHQETALVISQPINPFQAFSFPILSIWSQWRRTGLMLLPLRFRVTLLICSKGRESRKTECALSGTIRWKRPSKISWICVSKGRERLGKVLSTPHSERKTLMMEISSRLFRPFSKVSIPTPKVLNHGVSRLTSHSYLSRCCGRK